MANSELEVIFKTAQIINFQIESCFKLAIDLETLHQLPTITLDCQVRQFVNDQGFEPIASADWIQRNHDISDVLTVFSVSVKDKFVL
jgi:ubiquinone biosynthesis protein COQ4